jgi:hypothetical protein
LNLNHCLISYETDLFDDPFAACSNLRSLCLRHCSFYRLKVLRISGLQLANLDTQGWFHSNSCCNRIEIFTPKLTSFRYSHSRPVDFSRLDLPSPLLILLIFMSVDHHPMIWSATERRLGTLSICSEGYTMHDL